MRTLTSDSHHGQVAWRHDYFSFGDGWEQNGGRVVPYEEPDGYMDLELNSYGHRQHMFRHAAFDLLRKAHLAEYLNTYVVSCPCAWDNAPSTNL
jgi:hypothetical protein